MRSQVLIASAAKVAIVLALISLIGVAIVGERSQPIEKSVTEHELFEAIEACGIPDGEIEIQIDGKWIGITRLTRKVTFDQVKCVLSWAKMRNVNIGFIGNERTN